MSDKTTDLTALQPEQKTLVRRLLMGFLNLTAFYYVALKPSVQMATFVPDSEVLSTFLRNLVLIILAYALAATDFGPLAKVKKDPPR